MEKFSACINFNFVIYFSLIFFYLAQKKKTNKKETQLRLKIIEYLKYFRTFAESFSLDSPGYSGFWITANFTFHQEIPAFRS